VLPITTPRGPLDKRDPSASLGPLNIGSDVWTWDPDSPPHLQKARCVCVCGGGSLSKFIWERPCFKMFDEATFSKIRFKNWFCSHFECKQVSELCVRSWKMWLGAGAQLGGPRGSGLLTYPDHSPLQCFLLGFI
jgi:hypothetical protein